MNAASKPWWQQATAVVSLGASGAITGFSFTPGTAHPAAHPSPAQIRLLALQQVTKPAHNSDAMLRSAIVNVAQYYLRMAASQTPAAMEALIWQHDSADGVDHGPSCAAFASLTLELGSHAIGEQSWVTGGSSYPWPLHDWADVRVDPNPASPAVVSVLQDAQAHGRWHPLGDGYRPQPGDWVLFNGHVEVVTDYAGGVLHTIGGDSLPNFTVNAHEFPGSLSAQGVTGFVNNGMHPGAAGQHSGSAGRGNRGNQSTGRRSGSNTPRASTTGSADTLATVGAAAVPGTSTPLAAPAAAAGAAHGSGRATGSAVRSGGARPQAGSGSSGAPASQGPEPARGQWHATHPRTSHRPARPVHPHAPGARQADGNPRGGGTAGGSGHDHNGGLSTASVPGAIPGAVTLGPPAEFQKAANGGAVIPGLPGAARHAHGHRATAPSPGTGAPSAGAGAPSAGRGASSSGTGTGTSQSPPAQAPSAQAQMTSAQRAFIAEVAPGAVAAAHRYGVPASVTIAQAIDESGWGQSVLASKDHNLFGMKGEGPAGTDTQLTQEYENGQWVVTAAPFRAYQSVAQSIDDHGRLLASSDYYRNVMADRHNPDAFASALTGVYATDPSYGQTLIGLMRQYNLYQYDHAAPPAKPAAKPARSKPAPAPPTTSPAAPGQASVPGLTQPTPGPRGSGTPGRGSRPVATSPPRGSRPAPSSPPRTGRPSPSSPPGSTRPTPSSPPTSAPPPSSPPRAARTVPNSPARGGQPSTGSAPRSARSAPGAAQPGSSLIPGLTQPPRNSTGRASRPGTGAAGSGQSRRASAGSTVPGSTVPGSTVPGSTVPGSTVPGRAPARGSPQGAGSRGASQATRPAAPAGPTRSGNTGQRPSAKPVKAALVADWSPAPASARARTTPGSSATASTARASAGTRTTAASSTAASTARASAGTRTTAASSPEDSNSRASAVNAARGGTPSSRTTTPAEPSPGEPSPGETTAEWDPASWVPNWANEAGEPADTEAAGVEPDADGLDGTATVDTTAGQAGTGRGRVATGLRSRLAAVRPSRTATAAGPAPGQGRYQRPLPRAVRNAFQAMAAGPLERAEPLYRDVAGHTGLPWELLAACDWMQCEAKPRHSPVHGEKLGTSNDDGTAYWTKSAALEQCAEELIELASTVYGIDLTRPGPLSVRDLANAFAAFRWGELLKVHRTSAMEFPYSVAGLTVQHIGMRWPTINDPNAPDKPGGRFRMHFGAVPVLLSLDYPALA